MDLIERYIYAVTKRLPDKQREDIEKELRTLIDDMLEKYEGNEPYEVKVQKVLLDLGDPEVIADNYRSAKRYLIGPENYDNYMLILKIVFGAVCLAITISTVLAGVFANEKNVVDITAGYIGTLFSALMQSFAWVTIIFAAAERKGVNLDGVKLKDEPWSLSDLPPIPEKKAAISPVEPIVSIIFSAIFMTVFLFAPQFFSAYIADGAGGINVIPVFDIRLLSNYRMLFIVVFVLGVSKEAMKLIAGRWSLKLSVATTIISIVTTTLMVILFANPAVWNPSFAAEITRLYNLSIDFSNVWAKLTAAFVIIMVAGCIIDGASALYKGIKYDTHQVSGNR